MTISKLRWSLLALSFFVLLFGAYAGLHWGDFLPTFSCVFVNARAGTCFMLTLQQTIGEFTIDSLLVFLERLLYFSFLVILIGRAWCGWICPLGFLQDALDFIREKLKVSYVRFGERVQRRLVWIKWTFLSIALLIPVWVAFPVGCPGIALNLYIPFCQICPGKYLLPLCSGNPSRVAVSFDGGTTIFMSVVGLTFSIVTFIGSFIKRRFWCSFCPLGLILSWYRKISFLKLKKDDEKCTRCEICYNACPIEIEEVYKSRGKEDVTVGRCTLCMKCVENCPETGALKAEFLGKAIYTSSFDRFFAKRRGRREKEGKTSPIGNNINAGHSL